MRGAGVLNLIIEFLSRRTGQSENKDSKILTLQSLKRYQTLIADLWFQEGKFEWEYCNYVWSGMNCRFPNKMNHSMNHDYHEHVDISIIPALVSMDHPDPDWPLCPWSISPTMPLVYLAVKLKAFLNWPKQLVGFSSYQIYGPTPLIAWCEMHCSNRLSWYRTRNDLAIWNQYTLHKYWSTYSIVFSHL